MNLQIVQKSSVAFAFLFGIAFPLAAFAQMDAQVKHIIGVPGDTIEIKPDSEGNTRVYRNGQLLNERVESKNLRASSMRTEAFAVPKENAVIAIPKGVLHKGDLSAVNSRVEIRGELDGSLLAYDCRINIRKGAVINGNVIAVGDKPVDREDGSRIAGVLLMYPTDTGTPPAHPSPSPPAVRQLPATAYAADHTKKQDSQCDWLGAQIFYTLCGLVIALLALVIAPSASLHAAAAIDSEPLRCGIIGAVGLLALGLLNVVNSLLCYTVVWIPAGVIFMILSGLLFVYSGILGIVFLGGRAAAPLGWHGIGFFGRAAVGLIFLAILNCVPILNLLSLGLESAAFLLGLGGLVITGLGRDPQWLSKFLSHGDRRP